MLPVINLDNENYEEIFEKARGMIAGLYPEWTDYNEHDPGITFLQLMAWMKEMQQFHLDQIGDEHRKIYLKILGMKQRRRVPARTYVKISGFAGSFLLPRGTRLLASDIPFETEKDLFLEQAEVTGLVSVRAGGETRSVRRTPGQEGRMRWLPFGPEPEAGNWFLLQFDRPLTCGIRHTIYFDLEDDCPVARNPADSSFIPLVRLRMEYYGKDGFSPCAEIEDGTGQLLYSGMIGYTLPADMAPMEDGTYGLRFLLAEGEYDVAPAVRALSIHMAPVTQKRTLAGYRDVFLTPGADGLCRFSCSSRIFSEGELELYQKTDEGYIQLPEENVQAEKSWNHLELAIRPLKEKISFEREEQEDIAFCIAAFDRGFRPDREYEMDGFPGQVMELNDRELLGSQFELMAERPGHPGLWERWEKTDDFHTAAPESRVYIVNEEQGTVTFGDCERGMAPEGRLRILSYARTQGSGGNVRKGQINVFENRQIHGSVSNKEDISSGRDSESIRECFARFREESGMPGRAVTAADFERAARMTPGLRICQVRAVCGELSGQKTGEGQGNSISVVVQPFSQKPGARLTAGYMANLTRTLDRVRLVGTKVQILSPEYIGASVFADVLVKPHYPAARQMVDGIVRDYFRNAVSGFGASLEESELYGRLDAAPCVAQVRNLNIYAQGRGVRRSANGSILLPVNGLVYLKQADYIISAGGE